MKRLFTFLSTCIVMLFFIWMIGKREHQIRYAFYPSVQVSSIPENSLTEHERVKDALTALAHENNSVIARRISKLNEQGQTIYVYDVYGGELPQGFTQASSKEATESALTNSYLIVKGSLTQTTLRQTLTNLQYKTSVYNEPSNIEYVIALALSNTLSIAFIVLLITFIALTVIYRIKELRHVGIKLIAGEKLSQLMLKAVLRDSCDIGIASTIAFIIGCFLLWINGLFDLPFLSLLLTAVVFFAFLLFVFSASLSLLYLFGMKKSGLMAIIKGKLPLKRLLAVLLIGQLLAILIVGFSMYRVHVYHQLLAQQTASDKEWDKHSDYFKLTFYLSDPHTEKNAQWLDVLDDAIKNHNALFVKHNLINFIGPPDPNTAHLTIDDYDPNANTLYVTPNYFDELSIPLDQATKEKINHLQPGQFGLLLPESLQNSTEHYQKLYTEFMNKEQDDSQTPTTYSAIVGFLPKKQSYFMFNQSAMSTKQYLNDPIIVVITPHSLGKNAYKLFWTNALDNYFYLANYDDTVDLLKKHNVFHMVTHIKNTRLLYYEQVENIKLDTTMAIIGGCLGMLTSVILFNAMNLLYFEQFRREIFIKRIAGMTFIELHKFYLCTQFSVLLLGFSGILWLTKHHAISMLTLALFTINALLTLYYQMRKEEKTAITVLKGE